MAHKQAILIYFLKSKKEGRPIEVKPEKHALELVLCFMAQFKKDIDMPKLSLNKLKQRSSYNKLNTLI